MVIMSESAYERGLRHGSEGGGSPTGSISSGGGSTFLTKRVGPLPIWGWAAILLLLAVGYYMWHKNQNSSAPTSTTSDSQIPQFVNQVYTNPSPPDNDTLPKPPSPKPKDKDKTWTASATASTLAEIGKRLGVSDPAKNLQPMNTIARNFMEKVYPKNHNAKVPKGATFSYEPPGG